MIVDCDAGVLEWFKKFKEDECCSGETINNSNNLKINNNCNNNDNYCPTDVIQLQNNEKIKRH